MDPESIADREPANIAVSVLRAAFESTTDTAVKEIGSGLLSFVVSSAIASPVSTVLVEVFKMMVSEVLKETAAVEVKMNLVLAEPLRTAVATLRDVLAVTPLSEDEIAECDRQIAEAFDSLRKAEVYAGADAVSQLPLIRIHLALAAALKHGGRPFAELYVNRMRLAEPELREAALRARREAESLGESAAEKDFRERAERGWGLNSMQQRVASRQAQMRRETRQEKLIADAERLEKDADQIMLFCDFIIAVATRRIDLRSLLMAGRGEQT